MKTTYNTAAEIKALIANNRESISNINGHDFTGRYPILIASNKHVYYYSAKEQDNVYLNAPFEVTVNNITTT